MKIRLILTTDLGIRVEQNDRDYLGGDNVNGNKIGKLKKKKIIRKCTSPKKRSSPKR